MLKYFASMGMAVLGLLLGPSTGFSQEHIVRHGETLWGITRQHGVSYKETVKLNGLSETNAILRIGQKLKLPGKATPAAPTRKATSHASHTVRSGQTLYAIARQHGVPITALKQANPGIDPKTLHIGQTLKVPRYGAPKPRTTTPPPKKVVAKKPAETPKKAVPKKAAPPVRHTPVATAPPPQNRGAAPSGYAFYQAVPGDTMAAIANRYRLSKEELLRINRQSSNPNYRPRTGELIMVPTDGTWQRMSPPAASVTQTVRPAPQSIAPTVKKVTKTGTDTVWARHTVKPNDTLEDLAKHFNITVDQIRLDNPGIRKTSDLRLGTELKIRLGSL